MLYNRSFLFICFLAGLAMLLGCSTGRVSVDEAYHQLEPVKALELPEQTEDNLTIQVKNVADEYNSYKNRVEVLVNNKVINPNWNVSNIESDYIYNLKVKPGYYDIKAYYYAYVGWGEEKYEIKTSGPVRVSHDDKTLVSYELVKQENGEPVDKNMMFHVSTDGIVSDGTASATRPQHTQESVILQINTVPENAKIILDDKVKGNAPLQITISPTADYVLQISAKGFKTYTKRLDRASLIGKDKVLIIQELEAN